MSYNAETGIELKVVRLCGHLTVIKVDHNAHRMGAWSLIDGKWVDADLSEAIFNALVIHGVEVPSSPPLPSLWHGFNI